MTRQQILTTFKKQRQLLPLLLLMAYDINVIMTSFQGKVVLAGEIYDFALSTKHYISFGVIVANFLTYFFFRQFYKYTLSLTIAIGLFNLITFSPLEETIGFGFNSAIIGFQTSAFWAGLLAYFINFKRVNELIVNKLASNLPPEEQKEINNARFEDEVAKFKNKYQGYSNENLKEIVTANKYLPQAIEAARQLLSDRQLNENIS